MRLGLDHATAQQRVLRTDQSAAHPVLRPHADDSGASGGGKLPWHTWWIGCSAIEASRPDGLPIYAVAVATRHCDMGRSERLHQRTGARVRRDEPRIIPVLL